MHAATTRQRSQQLNEQSVATGWRTVDQRDAVGSRNRQDVRLAQRHDMHAVAKIPRAATVRRRLGKQRRAENRAE
jgi:hypothetical protein